MENPESNHQRQPLSLNQETTFRLLLRDMLHIACTSRSAFTSSTCDLINKPNQGSFRYGIKASPERNRIKI